MDESEDRVAAIYEEHAPRMWRALFSFSGDPEIASDAMAEAFALALRDGGSIRDIAAWTWRVSFRLAAKELKARRSRAETFEEPTYEMPQPIPHVIDALRRLTPNQRMAVILHDYADRTVQEVADGIGCARPTVYVHLSEGRRRLRSLLKEDA